MYGKNVELRLSNDVVVTVWVWCLPSTPVDILYAAAFEKLKETIDKQGDQIGHFCLK